MFTSKCVAENDLTFYMEAPAYSGSDVYEDMGQVVTEVSWEAGSLKFSVEYNGVLYEKYVDILKAIAEAFELDLRITEDLEYADKYYDQYYKWCENNLSLDY
jgi:hypothetical protein